jgi:hypothetical protein
MKLDQLNEKSQLEWFVGFAEGDGSWQVDARGRSIFIINQQDPQILNNIKKLVGFGQVNGPYPNKNGGTYYRYRVGNLKGTKKLIDIFNGNFVLNKTEKRFGNYLKAYNAKDFTEEIPLIKEKHIPTLNDHWLSGFIDAEGSFNGTARRHSKEGEPLGVQIRFTLTQKDEHKTMHYLAKLFGAPFSDDKSNNTTRLFIGSIKSRNKVIKYLNAHPLHSNKNVPFTRFKKLHVRLTDGKFKWRLESRRAKERIITLVQNINKDV